MSFGEGNLRTAVADMQREIDRLEAENAELRRRVDELEEYVENTRRKRRERVARYRARKKVDE